MKLLILLVYIFVGTLGVGLISGCANAPGPGAQADAPIHYNATHTGGGSK